ncbi:hypothetical protein Droror1_Dr00004334 [Drosera rotundifolia]
MAIYFVACLPYGLDELISKEVLALPQHLQETLVFFTYIRRYGTMDEFCTRPTSFSAPPFLFCTCRECLDLCHQSWAEAEEKHWNIMNHYNENFNYFHDHQNFRPLDHDAIQTLTYYENLWDEAKLNACKPSRENERSSRAGTDHIGFTSK